MKTFLAIYLGTPAALDKWNSLDDVQREQREADGMKAWETWAIENKKHIVDSGTPIGKTKKINSQGIADTKNQITAYVLVKAESHEAAAKLFEHHPHFALFPGDSVEVMECLPMPGEK